MFASPDFRGLKSQMSNFEDRLKLRMANTDEELCRALADQKQGYDKELILQARRDLERVRKELDSSLDLSSDRLSTEFFVSSGLRTKESRNAENKVKLLEDAIRERDLKIKTLEEELAGKQRTIEEGLRKLRNSKKDSKENAKKIRVFREESEGRIEGYRKMTAQLELENREVFNRIRLAERERDEGRENIKKLTEKICRLEGVKKENSEIKKKIKESLKVAEELNGRYESLMKSSRNFEEKTRELVIANKTLQEHIFKLLPNE